MAIIGFNFTKMNIEKKKPVKGSVSINNNIKIIDVKENEVSIGSSEQKTLKFVFEFTTKFEPGIGLIELVGETMFLSDNKNVDEIYAGWKKDKKVPQDVMTSVLNTALNKCNVQALFLSQQLNLPSPIPLPKVQAESKPAAKKKK